MGASSKIIELRKILSERFPKETAAPLFRIPTGSVLLDSVLGGGLPRCGITELIIPNRSSGSAVLLQEIIDGMHQQNQYIALIDAKNSFEPFSDHPLLLWIRCMDAATAIKVADLILPKRGGDGCVRSFIEILFGIDKLSLENLDELIRSC